MGVLPRLSSRANISSSYCYQIRIRQTEVKKVHLRKRLHVSATVSHLWAYAPPHSSVWLILFLQQTNHQARNPDRWPCSSRFHTTQRNRKVAAETSNPFRPRRSAGRPRTQVPRHLRGGATPCRCSARARLRDSGTPKREDH